MLIYKGLEANVNQKKDYEKAIEIFVDSIKSHEEVIGILVCGSFVRSELDKHSDIDIHVVLDEKCDYRERGNTWIEGIEIEYFKNPPKQIRSYFKQEKESPHTADMFVNSIVKYKASEIIDELIEEAKIILGTEPQKLKEFEIETSKYHIDDLFKDLKDCFENNDKLGFYFVKSKIIDECIFVFSKLKQFRKTKEKRLFSQIKKIDSEFAEKIEDAIEEDLLTIKKIKILVEHLENLLGGKRSKEWTLKGELDL